MSTESWSAGWMGENTWFEQCVLLTFMIRSGLNVPTPAIPMPDLAVPYAAPAHPNIMAAAIPPCMPAQSSVSSTPDTDMGHGDRRRGDGDGGHTMPMNGANLGDSSESAMIAACLLFR